MQLTIAPKLISMQNDEPPDDTYSLLPWLTSGHSWEIHIYLFSTTLLVGGPHDYSQVQDIRLWFTHGSTKRGLWYKLGGWLNGYNVQTIRKTTKNRITSRDWYRLYSWKVYQRRLGTEVWAAAKRADRIAIQVSTNLRSPMQKSLEG